MDDGLVLLDRACPGGAELGGKGASLARMVAAGHHVPRTGVLPIDAYLARPRGRAVAGRSGPS